MAFYEAMEFHEGEVLMHEKLHVPSDRGNPTVPMLTPQLAHMLSVGPLLALGTLDAEGRPWTSLWGGEKGFARAYGGSVVGIKTPVAATLDPVVEALVGRNADGEVHQEEGPGRMVSGLTIDLETRKRVKLAGRMVAGSLNALGPSQDDESHGETDEPRQGLLGLVVKIEQSLGNCPKYLNKKQIVPALTAPRIISEAPRLDNAAIELVQKSDLFFMSTSHSQTDMDTNHRGGPAGFVRVIDTESGPTQFVYPEYSGNRLYQSLGNMILDPKAGFCFPDFDTGDCLYLTGTTEILFGKDAADVMPRSNLAVRVTVTAARHVAAVLPFRGYDGEVSPYNPVVRFLKSEGISAQVSEVAMNTAKLLEQTPLTPTISRFRFSLSNPVTYTAGQYVTLDCSEHLDIGYSHMREDDPRSLNDDFIRTFTVSSPPGLPPRPTEKLSDDEFEITIRKVGVVTDFLFKHGLESSRQDTGLEIGIKGFGGTFAVVQHEKDQVVGFVAAGVGITPLMPSLSSLNLENLWLLWTVRWSDLGLVSHLLGQHSGLAKSLRLFVTGKSDDEESDKKAVGEMVDAGVMVEYRRMQEDDVKELRDGTATWYVCTGTKQRDAVLKWLEGREVLYEDYNF